MLVMSILYYAQPILNGSFCANLPKVLKPPTLKQQPTISQWSTFCTGYYWRRMKIPFQFGNTISRDDQLANPMNPGERKHHCWVQSNNIPNHRKRVKQKYYHFFVAPFKLTFSSTPPPTHTIFRYK